MRQIAIPDASGLLFSNRLYLPLSSLISGRTNQSSRWSGKVAANDSVSVLTRSNAPVR